jgi:DNA-directed RNA polymerase alpha subunit
MSDEITMRAVDGHFFRVFKEINSLSTKASGCLRRMLYDKATLSPNKDGGTLTLSDLANMSDQELLKMKNCGKKTLAEIKKLLKQHGLKQAPDRCRACGRALR